MAGTESFPKEAWINWRMAVEKPYIIGDFVWTGMDYIGEVGIGNSCYGETDEKATPVRPWPWYLSWCGDIDLCGNKKPQSYYRDVVWGQSDLEVLVHSPVPEGKTERVSLWGWPDEYPHWNWVGNENNPLQVSVYANFDTVRLYLNERFTGEKPILPSSALTATFPVPYQPGELTAVGVKNGKEVCSKKLITTGQARNIRLVAEQPSVSANPNDLAYVQVEITDEAGRLVPDAAVTVHLSAGGNGQLIASGNAAPDDLKSFRNPVCATFRGRALAILQPGNQSGSMYLTATADGFQEAKIEITVE
jgi:beta-galactosidase